MPGSRVTSTLVATSGASGQLGVIFKRDRKTAPATGPSLRAVQLQVKASPACLLIATCTRGRPRALIPAPGARRCCVTSITIANLLYMQSFAY